MLKHIYTNRISLAALIILIIFSMQAGTAHASKDTSTLYCPGGTLKANAWRGKGESSGNTKKWEYLVSSKYNGKTKVKWIQTKWYCSASLRKSASISIGISDSSVSAGRSSSWKTVKSRTKYWKNSNGAKSSDWRSNVIVAPKKDYRSNTIYTCNTGTVKLKGYPKKYEISAGV